MRLRLPETRRVRVILGVSAGLVVVLIVLAVLWKQASNHGGQRDVEPFRIAGNLYDVGADDVASFLLTGPKGHVLTDGGCPGTAPMIRASIEALGVDTRDVRILLTIHYHFDHAGGLAALQEASGAELWVSEGDAGAAASGGDDRALGILGLLVWTGMARYPRPRVDHRFQDGDTIRLGPIALTGHVTPGHARGCTTWTFPVPDDDRQLLAGLVCGVGMPLMVQLFGFESYPQVQADDERSFQTWRSLPVDIFLAPHARAFGRWRTFQARAGAEDPVAPIIDPEGYRAPIDDTERRFRAAVAQSEKRRP